MNDRLINTVATRPPDQNEKEIYYIPSQEFTSLKEIDSAIRKKRVAAYARVSTEQEEQQQSYEAQVGYYTNFIRSNPDWEFVGVYADEGITGTNTKKREGFNRMMEDARNGKIDIILTKSISRFARNTIDTLRFVRELQDKGIEVRFEKENINTLNPQSEVMLTILSSLAQEESRSISTNVTWGKQKKMLEGKVTFTNLYGYNLVAKDCSSDTNSIDENGISHNDAGSKKRMVINEQQAEVIVKIYNWFLAGDAIGTIASKLEKAGIKTPRGNDTWTPSTIESILTNEKYKGDILMQKTYTVNFLTKQVKKNNGERERVYVVGSHPGIIPKDTFDLVQYELGRRRPSRNQTPFGGLFAGLIVCGHCGAFYGHKSHLYGSTRIPVWVCNSKRYHAENCIGPNTKESDIKDACIEAIATRLKQISRAPLDISAYERKQKRAEEVRQKAEENLMKTARKLSELTNLNTKNPMDQARYREEYNKLLESCRIKKEALNKAEAYLLQAIAQNVRAKRMVEGTIAMLNIIYSNDNRTDEDIANSVAQGTSDTDFLEIIQQIVYLVPEFFVSDIFHRLIYKITIKGVREHKEIVLTFGDEKNVVIKRESKAPGAIATVGKIAQKGA